MEGMDLQNDVDRLEDMEDTFKFFDNGPSAAPFFTPSILKPPAPLAPTPFPSSTKSFQPPLFPIYPHPQHPQPTPPSASRALFVPAAGLGKLMHNLFL